MVSTKVSVNGAAASAYNEALKRLSLSLGNFASTAPRRAAIQLCKNFRAATAQAKKLKRIEARVSRESPQWITYKDGQKLHRPMRRWTVTILDRGLTVMRYVYADNRSDMKRQLREMVGTNYFPQGAKGSPQKKGGVRGLAKRSWGWVMHNIFNGAAPDSPWSPRKRDKRDPKAATRGSMSRESWGVDGVSGFARISNSLSYIREALKISPDAAMKKAASAIVRVLTKQRLKRQSGMSPAEIKAEADRIAADVKREFADGDSATAGDRE